MWNKASRIRTIEWTYLVMLSLTLSSCLRESSSLLVGRATTSRNGAVRRNQQLYRPNQLGGPKKLRFNDLDRPTNRFFFQNHKLVSSKLMGEIPHSSKNVFQPPIRYRTKPCIQHYRPHRTTDDSSASNSYTNRIFRRNLCTHLTARDDHDLNNNGSEDLIKSEDIKSEDMLIENQTSPTMATKAIEKDMDMLTENSTSPETMGNGAKRERLLNVLSIDPEEIDIYERFPAQKEYFHESKEDIGQINVNPFGNRNFIDMFRGSANYIASHRNTLAVFHIPGDLMDENPAGFRDLMNDISLSWLLGMKIVIVAGCGYQVNRRLNEDDRHKHMGIFVTDHESLRIVKEEAGYVRFEVERQLARALKSGTSGSKGDGMVGGNVISGNFYSAQPFGVLDGVDYKYSGFVRRMEVNKIDQVHKNRDIVLLTSLGFSPTGEVFNVNSEYLAAFAAGELGANKMIYFLQKNAALRHKIHGSNIPHLRVNDGKNLLKLNGVRTETKGFVYMDNCPYDYGAEQQFLVKMGWGMNALRAGVKRVHLISPYDGALLQELYTRDGSGTMISGDLYDGIHNATVDDLNAIYEVITPLVEKGILVERSKAQLERDIDQYHVYTRDDLLIACGQLKYFENGYAEFGCLVVNPLYRAKGRGDAMLGYLERLCVQNGATTMFVLSTQTMEWFCERGFDEVSVDRLPPSRQLTYNHRRGSKIYMKRVHSERDLDASELFWDR